MRGPPKSRSRPPSWLEGTRRLKQYTRVWLKGAWRADQPDNR